MIVDLKKYKQSKQTDVYLRHLSAIIYIINLSIKGLSFYRAYTPVMKILIVLDEQKRVLESHVHKLLKSKEEQKAK